MPRMASVIEELKRALLQALPGATEGMEINLGRPPKPELGDFAVPVFGIAKALGSAPADLARTWAAALQERPDLGAGLVLERAVPAGGFMNLTLTTESLLRTVLSAASEEGSAIGRIDAGRGTRVMVEYSSPNTNKPLHLGHLRNNAIGMSLTNLLEAAGYEVVRTSYVNDRGIHICKSMLAYSLHGNGETPASTGEKGDHFVGRYYVLFDTLLRDERRSFHEREGIDPATLEREERDRVEERFLASSTWMAKAQEMLRRWEGGDAEVRALWQRMNEWVYEGFRATYDRLGCRFDKWYFESDVYELGKQEVERGLAGGHFYRKPDGSVWASLEDQGLDDKLVLRADGTSVYVTGDIAVAHAKNEDYHLDRSIYVVAQEQDLHFRNLFAIFRRLGYPWAGACHHLSYGMVILPRGLGRLKSREGTSVDVDDMLDHLHEAAQARIVEGGYCGDDPDRVGATAEAIGQGALKVYLLQVGNEKNIVFDPAEKLSFEGDTGPAIQYSHARICGILRKGLERGVVRAEDLVPANDAPEGVYAGVRAERVDTSLLSSPEERALALSLLDLPSVYAVGVRQLSVAPLASWLLDMARSFARFYHEHRVLDAETEPLRLARLHLSLCVAQALRSGLRVLTVETPDRM